MKRLTPSERRGVTVLAIVAISTALTAFFIKERVRGRMPEDVVKERVLYDATRPAGDSLVSDTGSDKDSVHDGKRGRGSRKKKKSVDAKKESARKETVKKPERDILSEPISGGN